jgi:heat-inducible transcriptional repressor
MVLGVRFAPLSMEREPNTDQVLSARARQILESIVRAHIGSGEPVASRDVSRLRRHRLSAASIRSVMAELDELGYLSQPHPSAGRVPTPQAYRAFVRTLEPRRISTAEADRVREALGRTRTIEERVEATSHMLTGLTDGMGMGIAAAIPTSSQILERVELVRLSEQRVLMVVVTRDQLVRDQALTLDEPIAEEELTRIRNFLNEHYLGWALSDIQRDLQTRREQASAAYHEMLRKLIVLYDKCLSAAGLEPELHLEGASNLISFEFGLTRERLREMFRTLEEKKRILQLLDRFLEPPSGDVLYQIGLGEEDPNLGELSLIGVSIRTPGGLTSKFAVIGPMRMNYERAFTAVRHVSRAFQTVDS